MGYEWVTNEAFDAALCAIMDEAMASTLLSIPGIYEVLSEHFNNDVLERLEQERTPQTAPYAKCPGTGRPTTHSCVVCGESAGLHWDDQGRLAADWHPLKEST